MSKDFKNYKNVEKEGNIDMKLNIKVDKKELEETLDLLKQIKKEVKEINELMIESEPNPYDPFDAIARVMEVR